MRATLREVLVVGRIEKRRAHRAPSPQVVPLGSLVPLFTGLSLCARVLFDSSHSLGGWVIRADDGAEVPAHACRVGGGLLSLSAADAGVRRAQRAHHWRCSRTTAATISKKMSVTLLESKRAASDTGGIRAARVPPA